jgi:hypothetical protein
MIEGTLNEVAGAIAQVIADRDEFDDEGALAIMLEVENEDWFWDRINSLADAAIYHHGPEDEDYEIRRRQVAATKVELALRRLYEVSGDEAMVGEVLYAALQAARANAQEGGAL